MEEEDKGLAKMMTTRREKEEEEKGLVYLNLLNASTDLG
jgi:hypothetical protein